MDFFNSIKICIKKYAEFRGRASRSEFWYFMLFVTLLEICFDVLDAALSGETFWSYSELYGTFGAIFAILTFLPTIAVGTRRLHDVGKSGWWQLIGLTIIGIIPLIIWLCRKPINETNQYQKLRS